MPIFEKDQRDYERAVADAEYRQRSGDGSSRDVDDAKRDLANHEDDLAYARAQAESARIWGKTNWKPIDFRGTFSTRAEDAAMWKKIRETPDQPGEMAMAGVFVAAVAAFFCYMGGRVLAAKLGPTAVAVWAAAWPTTWLWGAWLIWLHTREVERAGRVCRTLALVGLAQSVVIDLRPALGGPAAAAIRALDHLTTQPPTWLALAAGIAAWQWVAERRATPPAVPFPR